MPQRLVHGDVLGMDVFVHCLDDSKCCDDVEGPLILCNGRYGSHHYVVPIRIPLIPTLVSHHRLPILFSFAFYQRSIISCGNSLSDRFFFLPKGTRHVVRFCSLPFRFSGYMACEFCYKGTETCSLAHFDVFAGTCGGAGRHEDTRGRVESFLNHLFAEDVVTVCIGCVLEIREQRKVGR